MPFVFRNLFLFSRVSFSLRSVDQGFEYREIASFIIGKKGDVSLNGEECEQACIADANCIGWEVCAPLGAGCDGCYRIEKIRPKLVSHPGWSVGLIEGR